MRKQEKQKSGLRFLALMFVGLLVVSCLIIVLAQQRRRTVSRQGQDRGSGAATLTVRAGGDFQQALDAARPGDTIMLEAGASFTGPFTLPAKPESVDAYVTIRSAAPDASLPASETRITPDYARSLPKLIAPGHGEAAVQTAPGAHHYRFIAVEFKPVDSAAAVNDLVRLGDGSKAQSTLDKVPHHLIFDRCYIHADAEGSLKRGIALNSAETSIINSYISDFKAKGQDAQAVCGWNGPGPFTIVNNYLEGSGENVLFGGSDPAIPGLVPSDIEFRRNHLAKPQAWRGRWSVKNIFELKSARRVRVDGNVMEYNWLDGQEGVAVLFTVRNQDGGAPWSVIEDVEFTNNIVRHSSSAISLLGRDNNHPSQQARGITIRNNLFEDINGGKWGGRGLFLLINGAADVTVDHNTVLQTGNVTEAYGDPNTGFAFTNNLVMHNDYGVHGEGRAIGNDTLVAFFPRSRFAGNLFLGAAEALPEPETKYPVKNFFTTVDEVGFVNVRGGDYRLKAQSRYRQRATDGRDSGCDFDELNSAVSGVVSPRL